MLTTSCVHVIRYKVPTTKAKKRKQRQLDVLYALIKCFIWVSRLQGRT